MKRFLQFVLLSVCLAAGLALADDSVQVLEQAPDDAIVLGEINATSRQFAGNTDTGKRNYVLRDLRRQAARLGGNALVVDDMQRLERSVPRYGRLPGQLEYDKVTTFRGRATVLRVPALGGVGDPLEPVEE